MRVDDEPAYLLHHRAYKESSALIEIITPSFGRVGLVHRGGRRIGKYSNNIHPFCQLAVSWTGRGELFTLRRSEIVKIAHINRPELQICGLYMNELITNLTPRLAPNSELYEIYHKTVFSLNKTENLEYDLRKFELALLKAIGYGLQLEQDVVNNEAIDPDEYYYYDNERGPISCVRENNGKEYFSLRGKTLIALRSFATLDNTTLREAKNLLRNVINYHLCGKPLITRSIMRYLDKY